MSKSHTATTDNLVVVQSAVRPLDDSNYEFASDFRKSNPGLHLLYVKTALKHLRFIDVTLRRIHEFGNTGMHKMWETIHTERERLIAKDAAYAEADQILGLLKLSRDTIITSATTDKDIE